MTYTALELQQILSTVDLAGFTYPLKGELGRYIIALTDNKDWSYELLADQANFYDRLFFTLSLGGWTSPEGVVIIDIGTSSDDLQEALKLAGRYQQRCIRDSLERKEIRA